MSSENTKKAAASLILGTVQFGLCYGLANRLGKPDIGRVREIIDLAQESGIRMLDTAAMYGSSEAQIGACNMARWSIITKVPSFDGVDDAQIEQKARASVLRSLDLLGVDALHAVLVHNSRDIIGERGRRLHGALEGLQSEGLVGRIGVSVYAPQDLAGIADECAQIVQAPFNVLDQRFIQSGEAAALRQKGGELHARSVFLQGLLLMSASERPARFAPWADVLSRYDQKVRDCGLDPVAFCLGFAARQADIAHCVVGVDSTNQLAELVSAFDVGQETVVEATELASNEQDLVDPRLWKDIT